jgi:hypothetical protein
MYIQRGAWKGNWRVRSDGGTGLKMKRRSDLVIHSPRHTMQAGGPVAQRLEQGTHNPLVRGSNPCGPTKLRQKEELGWKPPEKPQRLYPTVITMWVFLLVRVAAFRPPQCMNQEQSPSCCSDGKHAARRT